jgi:hypothetical protein
MSFYVKKIQQRKKEVKTELVFKACNDELVTFFDRL